VNMGFLISLVLGFIPCFFFAIFIYWLDRYEKEPKALLGGVFFWGALVAAGLAFVINTSLEVGIYFFTGSQRASEVTTSSLVAPVVEEILKGFAVLLVFWVFRTEFDSVLDGIIYAGVTALGFAATENAYYIYNFGYLKHGWSGILALFFIRVIIVGWQHPFYTSFTGIGLALARLSRNAAIRIFAPLLGLSAAIFTHGFHNTLADLLPTGSGIVIGSIFDWTGWLMMFVFILVMIRQERNLLIKYLKNEIDVGVISENQYKTACSAFAQTRARWSSLASGSYRSTNRFYSICGELAHKKRQLIEFGEEKANSQIVEQLREELRFLTPKASTVS
jgi:RsiW-degrading membrane proteinase PrsW (M82 family)